MLSGRGRVAAVFAATAAAMAADLASTWVVGGGDLAVERNVVFGWIGGGWPFLLGKAAVAVLAAILLFAWALRHDEAFLPPAGLPFRRFAVHFLVGTGDAPRLRRVAWLLGHLLPWVLVVGSLRAAAGNLLAAWSPFWWRLWRLQVHTLPRQLASFIVLGFLTVAAWLAYEAWRRGRSSELRGAAGP